MTVISGRFEWDSEKDESNRIKHGFSFSEILDVFDAPPSSSNGMILSIRLWRRSGISDSASPVAQELRAHGFDLYYFNSKRQGEIDFLIELDGKTVPVEVKSGKDYERHNALRNVLANEQYALERAFVLHNGNLSQKGKVTYLPIYMMMFLQKPDHSGALMYKLDLGTLA